MKSGKWKVESEKWKAKSGKWKTISSANARGISQEPKGMSKYKYKFKSNSQELRRTYLYEFDNNKKTRSYFLKTLETL